MIQKLGSLSSYTYSQGIDDLSSDLVSQGRMKKSKDKSPSQQVR